MFRARFTRVTRHFQHVSAGLTGILLLGVIGFSACDPPYQDRDRSKTQPATNWEKKEATPPPPAKSPAPRTPVREAKNTQDTQTQTVYVTRTGSKYHRVTCGYLRKSSIPISLERARLRYTA